MDIYTCRECGNQDVFEVDGGAIFCLNCGHCVSKHKKTEKHVKDKVAPSPIRYDCLELVLPIPPSSNVYWRHDQGLIHRSGEANSYKEIVKGIWLAEYAALQGFTCPVSVTLVCYMKYPRKGDLSNLEKILLDALQGYAFPDDNLVHELHMFRRYEKGKARVEVKIGAIQEVQL